MPNYPGPLQRSRERAAAEKIAVARHKKATALTDLILRTGLTLTQVRGMSDESWAIAAQLAGVRVPSDTTKALCMQMVLERRAHA